ncbi:MAG: multidrug DMT transporter permease [Actinobacteria bacterium HGW-Actinobacteria-5]|jgi:transporter family protein|nr:MAG: multidrug DMT transporter permease [Actinobacteria bacterium HGW-Actinobacteria-5]
MWLGFAFGSALLAGLTAVLAKIGVRHTDSTLATAVRTIVVLAAAWLMVFLVGSQGQLATLTTTTVLFLVLSGLATGGSWLCYFRALQLGEVNRVAPVDRSSLVLTVAFAMIFLGETDHLATRLPGLALIGLGTWLMVRRSRSQLAEATDGGWRWLPWAIGSAVFAALTAILGKVGIVGVESNLGTAIRTAVVLVMAWLMVAVTRRGRGQRWRMPRRDLLFIVLSGLATGASWLCYFRALQDGPASLVAPVDKLSIVFTVGFSVWVLHERVTRAAALGLAIIVAGTLLMLL